MGRLVINATHAKDDAERATLAFIVGATAVGADQECTIVLTVDGVWLATKGYAEEIQKDGFRPAGELVQEFLKNGGQLWACGACCKPRGITEDRLRDGAKIVGAANVVEVLLASDNSITF